MRDEFLRFLFFLPLNHHDLPAGALPELTEILFARLPTLCVQSLSLSLSLSLFLSVCIIHVKAPRALPQQLFDTGFARLLDIRLDSLRDAETSTLFNGSFTDERAILSRVARSMRADRMDSGEEPRDGKRKRYSGERLGPSYL